MFYFTNERMLGLMNRCIFSYVVEETARLETCDTVGPGQVYAADDGRWDR